MFRDHLVQLFKELNIDAGSIPKEMTSYELDVEGITVTLTDNPPGLQMSAILCDTPQDNQEEVFTKLLRGNFLGQATRRAALGLDESGTHIVVFANIHAIRSYREFHDALEDFVNVITFWKKELTQETADKK